MAENLNEHGKLQKEMAGDKADTVQFRSKRGSVIPPKRKLVKTMVFNSIVDSISSVLGSDRRASHSSTEAEQSMDAAAKVKINPLRRHYEESTIQGRQLEP